MPVIGEEAFRKSIKDGVKDNIFLFFGDDDYLKRFCCGKLTDSITAAGTAAFNFHTYEDAQTDLESIFEDADILPVMSQYTCLLIKNFPLGTLSAQRLKELETALTQIPESTVMIFYFSSAVFSAITPAKQKSIIGIFSAAGCAVRIDRRSRSECVKLLMIRAKDKGTTIDRENAEYLTDCVGGDMQNLLNEFNKVCAFSRGQPITKEMIDKTAVKSIEASVFDISGSILSGNTDEAYKILNELLRQKTSVQSVIGALANTYVNLYRYKTAAAAGKTVSDFAEKFQYRETKYQFRKIAAAAEKISMKAVRESIDILSEADIKSKSIKTDENVLLTELISKLALANRE